MCSFKCEVLHQFSSYHRQLIEQDEITQVSCFYCLEVYPKEEIREWIDGGCTALCPRCGIDAVLPEARFLLDTGQDLVQINTLFPELLREMHDTWFSASEEPHPEPDEARSKEPAQS